MNKIIKVHILLTCTILLSACGGGGGTGDSADTGDGVVNLPPQISGASIDYIRSGKAYSFVPVASDPENNQMIFSIENKPDWATFDQNTGELSGVPDDLDVERYYNITISVSDGTHKVKLSPFSVSVMYGEIGEKNITLSPDALVKPTADGYDVVGNASITVGNLVTEFKNADLQFEYDAEGNLLDLNGKTELPPVISENLSLDSSVNVIVGLYTGAEINASADIGPESEPGILLRDEFRYLVYFLDTSVDLTFHGADGVDEPISLGLGANRTLIVSDPTDPFFYYFGQVAGFAIGFGKSSNGHIPYQPIFEQTGPVAFEPLEPFLGTDILKGTFPITAYKVFDVLEMKGTAVCSPPQLLDCNKPDPASLVLSLAEALIIDGGIDPDQQFKVGLNGSSAIKFSVLGLDLFEYHLFDMAAMIDIGTTREHLAMQGVIDPAESKQPSWLPIKTVPEPNAIMVGNLFADVDPKTGDGDFGISLYGEFESVSPPAMIDGVIDINPQGLQMLGTIDDQKNPITVRLIVDDKALDASVTFGYDFQANADAVVNDALDRTLAEVDALYDELQDAIGDYDIALSLEGFRSQIPAIVDAAKAILDAIPSRVYTKVYNETYDGIINASYTYTSPIGTKTTFYAKDYVSASGTAKTAATNARNTAQNTVNARKTELDELKKQAQETQDDTVFRAALKTALLSVASHDKFSQTIKVTKKISFKIAGQVVASRTFTFYNSTLSYTVINSTTKTNLQTAANNVDNIEPNYTVMVNTQQLYDNVPKDNVVEAARSGVQNGAIDVPTINGGGYILTRDLEQSVYILLDNERIEIEFNPLDPAAAIEGIGDVIARQILK